MWTDKGLGFGLSLLGMLLMSACGGDSTEPNGAGGASGFPGLGGGARSGSPAYPNTGNWFLERIQGVDKIDLLFVIDNSPSMAEKQRLLREAVPTLLRRFITPACVGENGPGLDRSQEGSCPPGTRLEFPPVRDIHVGIVSSSLGDMGGGDACPSGESELDDKAYLLGTPGLRNVPLETWNHLGFLVWDPDGAEGRPRHDPGGISDPDGLVESFGDQISAVGDDGCAYEASLEAWYRFLVDPEPPAFVDRSETASGSEVTLAGPPDATILAQRRAFLRPDSLVAIVLLSDENDCSILDYGQGYLVGKHDGAFTLPRSTSRCEHDPNSPCCFSCDVASADVPSGCSRPTEDVGCGLGPFSASEDPPGLRCFAQRRRFGVDLLQPIVRYVQGLTQPKIFDTRRGDLNSDGRFDAADAVDNPLLVSEDGYRRDRRLVFLAGILGVPWPDLADQESWADARRLRFLSYDGLELEGRWDWILGQIGGPPRDGLMYETTDDRTRIATLPQKHPAGAVGGSLVPASSTARPGDAGSNPINGRERETAGAPELQAACIFPLAEPIDCEGDASCACGGDDAGGNPLCDGSTQTHVQAFPATRQLEVLRGVGRVTGNAVVTSVCPKVTEPDASPASDPNYGYNPASHAIVDRMAPLLGAHCVPRPIESNADGRIPCVVVEVRMSDAGACAPCGGAATPGRTPLEPKLEPAVGAWLRENEACAGTTGRDCEDFCPCQLTQFDGAALADCQQSAALPTDPGFCYVQGSPRENEDPDGAAVLLRQALLGQCPETHPQMLRFAVGLPAIGVLTFLACQSRAPE
jgi:hypothetical protein